MRLSLLKYLSLVTFIILGVTNISWTTKVHHYENENKITSINNYTETKSVNTFTVVYDSLGLSEKGLSQKAFSYAVQGMQELKEQGALKNDSVITIVDFDQPSYNKRMYIIDLKNYKILFNTWAAHGKNTGRETAESFSNAPESNKSSLGFYITDQTYYGSKGYSLRLVGLENNLNNNAFDRAIVLHGAAYVSQDFINAQGYIGRSQGCPAVPQELTKPIIEKIKNGSCMFIYNKSYHPSKRFALS